MKTDKSKFLLHFAGDTNGVPVLAGDTNVTLQLDGQDLFQKQSGPMNLEGYIVLTDVKPGKHLTLTTKDGELSTCVVETRAGLWYFENNQWYGMGADESAITILAEGVWKGSEKAFLNNQSLVSFVSFQPTEGELKAKWDSYTVDEFNRLAPSKEEIQKKYGHFLKKWAELRNRPSQQ